MFAFQVLLTYSFKERGDREGGRWGEREREGKEHSTCIHNYSI